MIRRTLERRVRQLARRHPVITVTGPRQSGKTTLCRSIFRGKRYLSLEALDVREYARTDPRGLLGEIRDGAVLDEIQRAPELLSYLQGEVDADPTPGRFVLTGSQNFALNASIAQSLAGRTAVVSLLPLALEEVRRFPKPPTDLLSVMWTGGYPAIHDRSVPAGEWLSDYIATYVERDVRQMLAVGDLLAFQTFTRLAAGRTASLLNLSSLGADAGTSHNTARAWLSVLEQSYLVARVPPWARNVGKRLVKTPKLLFLDSGLVCALVGIRSPAQLRYHPLLGAIFETWVLGEIFKARVHRGLPPSMSFYRDQHGVELDALIDLGSRAIAVEVKAGRTVAGDFFSAFARVEQVLARASLSSLERVVVYGGDTAQRRTEGRVVPWTNVDTFDWTPDRG